MKKIICILAVLLSACSKTEPSTAIADSIKQDVTVIEKQVETVKQSLQVECKTPAVMAQLDTIQAQVKTISTKADSATLACKTEKDVLKQENSKLKIVIVFLLTIGCGLIYLLTKKR